MVRTAAVFEPLVPVEHPRRVAVSMGVAAEAAYVSRELDASYAAFFRDEFARVVRTIYLIHRDEARAEDVAQEAFIQLLANWPKVSRYDRPDAWVRRVAIHLAMRGMRRDRLWAAIREQINPPSAETGSDLDLAAAVTRLPGNQRSAIVLFYYEDRPVNEVAAILGCSEATARVHLHRARARLALLLGEEVDGVA
jgi:RNA polymerase sigma-70 factor (ECF subfamily)